MAQMYDPRQHPVKERWRKLRITRWWMKKAARANDRGQRWLFALMRPRHHWRERPYRKEMAKKRTPAPQPRKG